MKRTLAIIGALVVAIVAGFLLRMQLASFSDMRHNRERVLSRSSDEMLVGVCWPSGELQDGMLDGVRMAMDEINQGNLAGGYKIRLTIRDDRFDVKRTLSIAKEFADTPKMSAVIGYYDDSAAINAAPIYEESGLFNMMIGPNCTQLTSYGFDYIVRTIVSSDKIASRLAKFTTDNGYNKIAVIAEDDAFGEDLAYQYLSSLDEYELKPVYYYSYSRSNTDFSLVVNQIKAIDADFVFFAGLDDAAIPFINKLRTIGVTIPILGAFGDSPQLLAEKVGKNLDNTMSYDIYDVNAKAPENVAFVKKFFRRYGRMPDGWAAQGYDAMYILANAARLTRSRNSLDLAYAVRYMNAWKGANGRYKFDGTGNLESKPIAIFRYTNLKEELLNASDFEEVKPQGL